MKRFSPAQLIHALTSSLASLYLLTGEDPLLLSEAVDQIKHKASSQGFDEKYRIVIDTKTNWQEMLEQVQSLGLFFQRQILHLIFPDNLSKDIQQHLLTLIQSLHQDVLVILQFPKWNKNLEKQEWFLTGCQINDVVMVTCQPPSNDQFPHYIQQRAKQMGLLLEKDVISLLCHHYEGNLLALKQALDLLSLLYPDGKLTFNRVEKVVQEACVFTVFQWIDALLAGQGQRAEYILHCLEQEDVQIIILLRTLQRELTILLQLTAQDKGIDIDKPLITTHLRQQFDKLRIWQARRPSYLLAIQRLTYRHLFELIQDLAELECRVKQHFDSKIWQSLALLGYRLANGQ